MARALAEDTCTLRGVGAVGSDSLADGGAFSWMMVVERCARCGTLYQVGQNLGSWQCAGHPGHYVGRKGTSSAATGRLLGHGFRAWNCCGRTRDPQASGRGFEPWRPYGCVRQDHSAAGADFVKSIPGSVIRLSYEEVAAMPRAFLNTAAFRPKQEGVYVLRFDAAAAHQRLQFGATAEELSDPAYVPWDQLRRQHRGRVQRDAERRYYGGAVQRRLVATSTPYSLRCQSHARNHCRHRRQLPSSGFAPY